MGSSLAGRWGTLGGMNGNTLIWALVTVIVAMLLVWLALRIFA